jgi:hypothetical protein
VSGQPLPEFISRKELAEEMRVSRAVVDCVFRNCPSVHLPGLRRPMVRRADVMELLEASAFSNDQPRVRS